MKRLAVPLLALALFTMLVAPAVAQTPEPIKVQTGIYWIILAERGPNWKSQATDEGAKTKMTAIQNLRNAIVDGEVIIGGLVIDDVAADFVMIVKAEDENKLRAQIASLPTVKNGFYKPRTCLLQAPLGLKLEPVPLSSAGK